MSTCSGHPPPDEGRKALQVREPSEEAPSSTTQGLQSHGLRKVERYHMNRLTIHKNSTKGTRERIGSRGQLTLACLGEQPREGAFNKGLRVGRSPGDGKLPRTSLLEERQSPQAKRPRYEHLRREGLLLAVT